MLLLVDTLAFPSLFDYLKHLYLLNKVKRYDVRDRPLSLIKSYLSHIMQVTNCV